MLYWFWRLMMREHGLDKERFEVRDHSTLSSADLEEIYNSYGQSQIRRDQWQGQTYVDWDYDEDADYNFMDEDNGPWWMDYDYELPEDF